MNDIDTATGGCCGQITAETANGLAIKLLEKTVKMKEGLGINYPKEGKEPGLKEPSKISSLMTILREIENNLVSISEETNRI